MGFRKWTIFLAVLISILFAVTCFDRTGRRDFSSTFDPLVEQSLNTAPSTIEVRKILTGLQNKTIRADSVEKFLALLPVEYLQRHALMYKSRSLQDADFENPRVIVYGEDGKTLMSFNGGKSQKGYKNLEVIHFNDAAETFSFREIEFSETKNGGVSFSKMNPEKCLGCHGSSPRPNWDAYPFWPGAYGSEDSKFIGFEAGKYATFAGTNRKRGRYAKLPPVVVFGANGDAPSGVQDINRFETALVLRKITRELAANASVRLYGTQILETLEELGQFEAKARTDLSGGDLDGKNRERFLNPEYGFSRFPPEIAEQLKSGFKKDLKRLSSMYLQSYWARRKRHLALVGQFMTSRFQNVDDGPGDPTNDIGSVLAVIQGENLPFNKYQNLFIDTYKVAFMIGLGRVLNFETANWSTEFQPRGYIIADGNFPYSLLASYLERALSLPVGDMGPPAGSAKDVLPEALRTCLGCHSAEAGIGPFIPFANSIDFKKALAGTASSGSLLMDEIQKRLLLPVVTTGHMPPMEELTPDEIQEALSYLESALEK